MIKSLFYFHFSLNVRLVKHKLYNELVKGNNILKSKMSKTLIKTKVSEITNVNSHSVSFAFLKAESDLYSKNDLKKIVNKK